MASLQDQLLKAGLVDEKKAKKANKDKRKQQKQAHKSKQAPVDETKLAAQKALADKVERDKELNKLRQEEANQKAIAAQIKQLITINKIDKGRGDIAYNFAHDGKFKKVYVTKQLQDFLSNGRLAIVTLIEGGETRYEIVPAPVAAKIAQRDDTYVALLNDSLTSTSAAKSAETTAETSAETSEEEDWYADYEIPDDLMW